MICNGNVSPKHRAKLSETKEPAFQDIAFCVAFQTLLISPNPTARRNPVQLFIIAKEAVGVAFNVPDPAHRNRLYIPFNHFTKQ